MIANTIHCIVISLVHFMVYSNTSHHFSHDDWPAIGREPASFCIGRVGGSDEERRSIWLARLFPLVCVFGSELCKNFPHSQFSFAGQAERDSTRKEDCEFFLHCLVFMKSASLASTCSLVILTGESARGTKRRILRAHFSKGLLLMIG